jgi:hypothetical protein
LKKLISTFTVTDQKEPAHPKKESRYFSSIFNRFKKGNRVMTKLVKSKYSILTATGAHTMDSMIEYFDENSNNFLQYRCKDLISTAEDSFPFFALVKLRQQLEKMNKKLLCNGARIDVYPSGSSAVGLMAYELRPGKQAKKLVNILDPSHDLQKIVSVDQQKAFRDAWLTSLKGR